MGDWPVVQVGSVAAQRREAVRLEPGVEYTTMGVRWHGKGAYNRGVGTTETIKAKTLYRARTNDFVFNRIDTQKGAFDVVPESLDGALATNEFPLYETDAEALLPHFLLIYFVKNRCSALSKHREGAPKVEHVGRNVTLKPGLFRCRTCQFNGGS